MSVPGILEGNYLLCKGEPPNSLGTVCCGFFFFFFFFFFFYYYYYSCFFCFLFYRKEKEKHVFFSFYRKRKGTLTQKDTSRGAAGLLQGAQRSIEDSITNSRGHSLGPLVARAWVQMDELDTGRGRACQVGRRCLGPPAIGANFNRFFLGFEFPYENRLQEELILSSLLEDLVGGWEPGWS